MSRGPCPWFVTELRFSSRRSEARCTASTKKRNKAVKLLKTKVSCDESRDLIQNKHLLQSLAADHDQDRSNQRAERAANQGKQNRNVSENKGDASI